MATTSKDKMHQIDLTGLAVLLDDLVVTNLYLGGNTLGAGALIAGASGTAGTITLFPATASKGDTTITMSNNSGNTVTNINVAAQAGARTLTIPDGGNATANFVLDQGAMTLNGARTFAANIIPTGGVAGAGANTLSPRCWSTGSGQDSFASTGVNATTETYAAEIFIPNNATLTGIAIFNGSAVAGNITLYLADATGANLAHTASTAISGTTVYQRVAFTPGTISVVGPATYFVYAQYNTTTSNNYQAFTTGNFGAGKHTGDTYGTFPTSFTPPTTFTASQGPVASVY